jgi:hypothetical protein
MSKRAAITQWALFALLNVLVFIAIMLGAKDLAGQLIGYSFQVFCVLCVFVVHNDKGGKR